MSRSEYVFVQSLKTIVWFFLGTIIVITIAALIVAAVYAIFTYVRLRRLQEHQVLRTLQQLVTESHGEAVPLMRLNARLDATATPNWAWISFDFLLPNLEARGLIQTDRYYSMTDEPVEYIELLEAGFRYLDPEALTDEQIRAAVDP